MAAKKVPQGIVVTFGNFTKEARNLAAGKSVVLISGDQLEKLISNVQISKKISLSSVRKPSCPECNSEMILRIAKKGKYAGQKFWGCVRFPDCRGVHSCDQDNVKNLKTEGRLLNALKKG